MARLIVYALAFLAATALPAQPTVPNRPPAAGEIGYLPVAGSTAQMNPPSLVWLHEPDAAKYSVEISRSSNFDKAISVSGLQFNCYTHNEALAPGSWWWRYRYTDARGQQSGWSAARQFQVGPQSIVFPLPSKAERVERIPKGHPRLFVRPETLRVLREAATNGCAKEFSALRAEADKLVGADLVKEPAEPGTASVKTNKLLLQNWWANRVQTLQACTEAETVAFVYLISGEKKYGGEARRRLLDLARWDSSKETSFRRNCEAAKPLLHRIARVYDWCYPELSAEDRKLVQAAVKQRIHDAWVSGEVREGTGHINSPHNSHGNRTFHKIGESGIVFLGEFPEAEMWLDYALNKFYACYPVWSDSEGGWHEGLAYWAGYMGKVVWWLDAMDVALGIDGFKKPFFAHVDDFGMYMAPPGSPNMGFGDLSFRAQCGSWGFFVDYFNRQAAQHKMPNAPYWRWWSEAWKMRDAEGVLGFLYRARMPDLPAGKPPTDLPKSKIFEGTGIASLHTTLENSKDDVHFLFKSSPFGGASHGFNAQNGFQLNAYGDCLLPACTYRDYFGTAFHYGWVHQTISQNAVLVNGKGQLVHSQKAKGGIVESHLEDRWSCVAGDAAPAYEGRLTRAIRRVVFLNESGATVIFDELAAPEPASYQFMLHGLSPFSVDPEGQRLSLQQPNAGLTVLYLAPEPLKLKEWDGFKPAPMRGDFPNQWHVEASTPGKTGEIAVITVLLPHKGTRAQTVGAVRLENSAALGVELVIDGIKTTVAVRKTGSSGAWELNGLRSEGPAAVRFGS